jgi:hypothetical protein
MYVPEFRRAIEYNARLIAPTAVRADLILDATQFD